MEEIRFPYKPKLIPAILAILLFGGAAIFMTHQAMNNDRGLILNGIIKFSVEGATVFYWALAVFSTILPFLGLLTIIQSLTVKREITIRKNNFTSPKNSFSSKEITMNFLEISDIHIQEIQKNKSLVIFDGKEKLIIPEQMLSDKKSFEQLSIIISEKASRKKSPPTNNINS